jgi:ribosomal-protein-alanine N-acetyltransferase
MTHQTLQILETDHLTLRVFEPSDLDAFAEIEADPDVMHYYSSGPRSRERVEKAIAYFQEMQAEYGHSLWAVDLRGGAKCIGYCGLAPQTLNGHHEVEIGYKLAKAYWGKGLATEAATAARDWGFTNLPVKRLISIVDPRNVASIRVAEKIGMHYVQNAEYDDKDCRVYALNRPQF